MYTPVNIGGLCCSGIQRKQLDWHAKMTQGRFWYLLGPAGCRTRVYLVTFGFFLCVSK